VIGQGKVTLTGMSCEEVADGKRCPALVTVSDSWPDEKWACRLFDIPCLPSMAGHPIRLNECFNSYNCLFLCLGKVEPKF